jgi:hypothetical protein
MSNGKRFYITIEAENLRKSAAGQTGEKSVLEQEYLRHLKAFGNPNIEPGYFNAFRDWALKPCHRFIRELAPSSDAKGPLTLQDFFEPVTFILKLVSVDGRLTAMRCPDDDTQTAHLDPQHCLPQTPEYSKLCRIHPSEVDMVPPGDSSYSIPPTKVLVNKETQLLFKKAECGMKQQVDRLLRLEETGLAERVRVPRLYGIVQKSEVQPVLGILTGYIDGHEMTNECSFDLRQKWASQIADTVQQLHDAGVIWGCPNPGNVLIDTELNAWVVGFEEGYVETWVDGHNKAWVDWDKLDTKEGDLQGLSRLLEFLGIGPVQSKL